MIFIFSSLLFYRCR